jgi:hypothetical protein
LEVVRVAENIDTILESAAHVHTAPKVAFVLYLWDYQDYVTTRSPQLGLLPVGGVAQQRAIGHLSDVGDADASSVPLMLSQR